MAAEGRSAVPGPTALAAQGSWDPKEQTEGRAVEKPRGLWTRERPKSRSDPGEVAKEGAGPETPGKKPDWDSPVSGAQTDGKRRAYFRATSTEPVCGGPKLSQIRESDKFRRQVYVSDECNCTSPKVCCDFTKLDCSTEL